MTSQIYQNYHYDYGMQITRCFTFHDVVRSHKALLTFYNALSLFTTSSDPTTRLLTFHKVVRSHKALLTFHDDVRYYIELCTGYCWLRWTWRQPDLLLVAACDHGWSGPSSQIQFLLEFGGSRRSLVASSANEVPQVIIKWLVKTFYSDFTLSYTDCDEPAVQVDGNYIIQKWC